MKTLTLYSMPSSGNSYKIRLLLSLIGRPYRHVPCEHGAPELDAAQAEGHLPLGKLPALHLEDGTILPESNAILWYLAQGTEWLPDDPLMQSQMLAWMFFEQNRHEPVIAVRASLRCYPDRAAGATPERMAQLLDEGYSILGLLERALEAGPFLLGRTASLADLALYAYTHSAGTRGGFDMDRFPAIRVWCNRIAALPGYEPLFPDA
ncbi:glutathione S-transferase [Pelagivirga sediminicola]|uniref:Glutathione S-transferase n=1 Tax=Pelagivirga sediminicola TaxID=2170575 RepID=A0A2T7G912_9RHOB|nr:glutathione S-transferase family protein [Pelagivirga sediminicola]PVA10903.1 glutathione S-transferase [Pelagivirga sediminicola]